MYKLINMKKILLIFLILLVVIPSAAAENVTIKGVSFEIPHQYEHGTLKESSYVYESGLTFRILNLDDSRNLKINFGGDVDGAKSVDQTQIAGHDAVVILKEHNSKQYTTVYFATGDKIFLICFNDTYVNDDISKVIGNTPQQTMSHDDFASRLNQALGDYEDQIAQENDNIRQDEYARNNRQSNRFFFFFR